MRKLSYVTAALLMSACAVGPDYQKPGFDLPSFWPWQSTENAMTRPEGETMDVITRDWWKQFNDPALTALVEEGLEKNADLLVAASRVAQARAALNLSEANLYPEIGVEANATRTSNSGEARFGGFNAVSKPFNDFGVSSVFSYELDLWGRLRRARESDRAQLLSVEANRDAIDIAVASDIATGYFNLRSLDAQVQVTKETIESRKEALRYQETQYTVGSVNGLTFRQAEAELADAEAQLPALEQARMEQQNALAILLGRSPKEIVEDRIIYGKTVDELPTSPVVPTDLPSSLIERRPDIVSAEQNLISTNADIGVAKADYFPRLSLSAVLGLSAAESDRVFRTSARRWNTGAAISAPLLDFGRRRANVRGAEARRDEALASYAQTVRVAFSDVLNSLSAEKTSALRETAQKKHITSRSEALSLAEKRYKAGYSNYLEVLDAQRFLYQAQLDRIVARRDRLIAAVNIYKSLGGGWTQGQWLVAPNEPALSSVSAEDKKIPVDTTPLAEAQPTEQVTEAAPVALAPQAKSAVAPAKEAPSAAKKTPVNTEPVQTIEPAKPLPEPLQRKMDSEDELMIN